MLDIKEATQNLGKIYQKVDRLIDPLSQTYDKVRIVYEFHHITIYAFQDNAIAKVTVTYEAILDTYYRVLVKQIKEAIDASIISACTIPIEYENPFVK